jgi:hypothetical protein
MALGSRMAEIMFHGPPQSGHFCMSIPNTRARSSAHRFGRVGAAGVVPDGSAVVAWTGSGAGTVCVLGTMSVRIVAWGARQPKNRVR